MLEDGFGGKSESLHGYIVSNLLSSLKCPVTAHWGRLARTRRDEQVPPVPDSALQRTQTRPPFAPSTLWLFQSLPPLVYTDVFYVSMKTVFIPKDTNRSPAKFKPIPSRLINKPSRCYIRISNPL